MFRFPIAFAAALAVATPLFAADTVELEFWRSVQTGGTTADYQAYIDRYPRGDFADLARNRIAAAAPAPAAQAAYLSRRERIMAQSALTRRGYDTRGVDGVFGRGTRAAIRGWQRDEGYPVTGDLTRLQFERLTGAAIDIAPRHSDAGDWADARAIGSVAAYERYLDRHPYGAYAREARRRIAEHDSRAGIRAREAALGLNRADRREVERRLARLGYYPGAINGRFDDDTRRAIRAFRRAEGLSVHGFLDRASLRRLVRATGGVGHVGRGEDYDSDAARNAAIGAAVLGGILLLSD